VVLHELLRQNFAMFADPNCQLSPARPIELVTGRPRYREIARHALKFARDLQMIHAYWTEMNERSRGKLRNALMNRELARLADELHGRVKDLVAEATWRERRSSRFEYQNLVHLAGRLRQNLWLANCQQMLAGHIRTNERRVAEDLRAHLRRLDVEQRRRALREVPRDELVEP
jgi:hypothetical protein